MYNTNIKYKRILISYINIRIDEILILDDIL